MIIKCPQCATGYNIPDTVLEKGPRKLRCAKCKNTFAVTKRSENPPSGYMEYTGTQELPKEFAFLKVDKDKPKGPPPAPDKAARRFQSDEDTSVGPAPQPPRFSPPPAPAQAPAAPPTAPPVEQEVEVDVDVNFEEPPVDVESEAPPRPTQGGGVPVRNSLPAVDMFGGGGSSAWEVEAPFELGGYAMQGEVEQVHGQVAGKVAFGLVLFTVGFFVFVAYRSGWSLSLSGLPDQVAFAFSGEATEMLPKAARNIDMTVVSKKMVLADHGGQYLMIQGEVINNNPAYRSNIILRGKLLDKEGNIKCEARMPCGKAIDEGVIKRTRKGALGGHFTTDGKLYNCRLAPNGSTIFQIIFEDVPEDYNATYQVKVQAVAAEVG